MNRLLVVAAPCCLAVLLSTSATAQLRFWAGPSTGLWADAARWSATNAPDSAAESAVFDLFGAYAVSVGAPQIAIDDLRIDRGNVTLRTTGAADATLAVGGDATIAGAVTLAEVVATHLNLEVQGTLSLVSGASLTAEGGPLSAAAASIAGGTLTGTTLLALNDGAVADLGELTVAPTGNAASRGGVDLYGGSSLAVQNLSIANEATDSRGEVNIVASSLTQPVGRTTVIGVATTTGGGKGTLAVSDGGTLELGSVLVQTTGKLVNTGGSVAVHGTSLDLVGGEYREAGAASRDFSGVAGIAISQGGKMTLVGAPLVLGASQQLTVNAGVLTSPGGLQVNDGKVTVSGDGSWIDSNVSLTAASQFLVGANGTTTVDGEFTDAGAEVRFLNGATLVFAGDYTGSGAGGNGLMRFEADSNAGVGVAHADFDSNVEWTAGSRLTIDLDGATHDTVHVGGVATLAGELALTPLAGPFAPVAGDVFDILTAGTISGGFSALSSPVLDGGLEWRVYQTPSSLSLRVVAPGVAGDFNYDGVVDVADYTVWRDTEGSTGAQLGADANGDNQVTNADYLVWKAAYAGAAASIAVPEPAASLPLAVMGLAGMGGPWRRKVARSPHRT